MTHSREGDGDAETVRRLLTSEASWTPPSDDAYVQLVVERMAELRAQHPDVDARPSPIHGIDETGACVDCDALRALDEVDVT